MVIVRLFAGFRERAKKEKLELDVTGEATLTDVITMLKDELPELTEFLDSGTAVIALNQEVVSLETLVKAEDEIAIFPPVSGG